MLKNSVWQSSDSQKLKCFAIPGIGQALRRSTAPHAEPHAPHKMVQSFGELLATSTAFRM